MSASPVVLLAWEMGAGFGHATRLFIAARELKRRGYTPVVAARDIGALADTYRAEGIRVLQAPPHRTQVPAGESFRAGSFSDIAAACGYQTEEALAAMVSAWDQVLDELRPAVVVTDYCPLLPLACYGRIPVLTIGDGFVVPPREADHMPKLQDDRTALAPEATCLANAQAVQTKLGRRIPPTLPSVIAGDRSVVCTFPEIDIYHRYRATRASGPLSDPRGPLSPPKRAAVFVYLASDFPPTVKMLQAVLNARLPVEAFVRHASPELREKLVAAGAKVHSEPAPIEAALERASVIVHHGGVGTIEAALMLGRPQILLSRHLEQRLNAKVLRPLQVSETFRFGFALDDATAAVVRLAKSAEHQARARAVAQRLQARGPSRSLDMIVGAVQELARN